jgi:5-methyltetrahydropteroyltriglutamate--homocysteine methyltransferase
MCWSSLNAPHTDDPLLAEMFVSLLEINAPGYQLEAANARHGHEYHFCADVCFRTVKSCSPA